MLPAVFAPLPEIVRPAPSVVTTADEKLLPRKLAPAAVVPLNRMVPVPPIVWVFCATSAEFAFNVTVRPALITKPFASASPAAPVLSFKRKVKLAGTTRSISSNTSVKVPLSVRASLPLLPL